MVAYPISILSCFSFKNLPFSHVTERREIDLTPLSPNLSLLSMLFPDSFRKDTVRASHNTATEGTS